MAFTSAELTKLGGDIVHVDDVIEQYCQHIYSIAHGDDQDYVSPSKLTYNINWSRAKIIHQPPKFPDFSQPQKLQQQAVYKARFHNDTDNSQENRFSAERTTRSKAEVVDYKGLCFSRGVKLDIPPIVSSTAGFPRQLNLCQMIDKAWVEELTWKVDNRIVVDPHQTVRARLRIEENEMAGSFSVETQMKGKVVVTLRRADTNSFVTSIDGTLVKIFEEAKSRGLNGGNIQIHGNAVTFVTTGTLNFRYGVQQHVEVLQGDDSDSD